MNAETSSAIDIRRATVVAGDREILRDISWKAARGEHWFILGANGAGKTTLIKVILGHIWPRCGAEVTVLGCRYGSGNLLATRKKIAWTSPFMTGWLQNGSPEDMTVRDVVLTGADASLRLYRQAGPEENRRADEALARLHGEDLGGRPFAACSSGEQVKALIARAMMSVPELLILDETCVHLDLQSREILLQAIDDLAANSPDTTMIFVTQRIEEITAAFTQGLVIADGRIAAQGNRDAILTPANMEQIFHGLKLRLLPGPGGRLWPLPAEQTEI